MANIIKDFLGYLKLGEDEEEYDEFYDEDEEEQERKVRKREARLQSSEIRQERNTRFDQEERLERTGTLGGASFSSRRYGSDEPEEFPREKRGVRMEKTTSNKVVPIRTTQKGMEVCIMKPDSFEDSQDICDMLLSGRAVVVNLEGFDPLEAQRIMDFISGSVYAISGKLHQISKYIFIFSPDSIDISGDSFGVATEEDGFEVPTLNKEF
ncbi:MAG: cell division protein SepF [Lachnospiraceae bacterium]|nr:cell division protein SepF [Lachnospiraceae bacterium]